MAIFDDKTQHNTLTDADIIQIAEDIISQYDLTSDQISDLMNALDASRLDMKVRAEWACHDKLSPRVGDTIEFRDFEGTCKEPKLRKGTILRLDAAPESVERATKIADGLRPTYFVQNIKGVKGTRTVYPRHVVSITTTRKVDE